MDVSDNTQNLLNDVAKELEKAQIQYPGFHSLHEGYAVLLSEGEHAQCLNRDSARIFAQRSTDIVGKIVLIRQITFWQLI